MIENFQSTLGVVKIMEIKVKASKDYPVIIKENLAELSTSAKRVIKGSKIAIITDKSVGKLYLKQVEEIFIDSEVYTYTVDGGEDSKSLDCYFSALQFLAENGFKRNDTVIALGGGVIGDLAGFTASTYMRGINLIMLPTSLLAMVDSSVGGKTAVNLPSGKNLVGSFYQPSLVYINTDFLKTLPAREVLSGKGEIIKYSFIGSGLTLEELKQGITPSLIYKCVDIKRQIVESDEFESGTRKLLNLGHTVGHAIEKIENYALSHGECVLKGLYYALEISKKLGVLNNTNYLKALEIISASGYNNFNSYDAKELIKYIKTDKKGVYSSVDFIVVDDNLKAQVKRIDIDTLMGLL